MQVTIDPGEQPLPPNGKHVVTVKNYSAPSVRQYETMGSPVVLDINGVADIRIGEIEITPTHRSPP